MNEDPPRAQPDSPERSTALADLERDLVLEIDASGRVVYAGPQCERILGRPSERLVGLSILELVPAEDREALTAGLAGLAAGCSGSIPLRRVRTPDGDERDVEASAARHLGLDGSLRLLVCCRDVAKPSRSAQAECLRASPRTGGSVHAPDPSGLLERLPIPVLRLDAQGILVEANPALARLLGAPPGTRLAGRSLAWLERGAAPSPGGLVVRLGSSARHGAFAARFTSRWGRELHLWVRRAAPAGRVKQSDETVLVLEDVAERHGLEAPLREIGSVVAGAQRTGSVAHDLSNFMSVILLYADLIADQPDLSGTVRAWAGEIGEAGGRAVQLIGQLLGFARHRPGTARAVVLNSRLASLGPGIQALFGASGRLEVELAPDLDPVWIDPVQVDRLVMNLALDARDAMPQGGTLRIETRNEAVNAPIDLQGCRLGAGRYVVLSMRDGGSGMDSADLAKVFEPVPGTRAGITTSHGLSLVHGIAVQNGGGMRVGTTPGRGSTIEVYLPRHEEAADPGSDGDEPLPDRDPHQAGGPVDSQLAHDVGPVGLHGAQRNGELLCDPLCREALREVPEDLPLAAGELGDASFDARVPEPVADPQPRQAR